MPGLTVTFGEIMLRLTPPGFERILQSPQFVATIGGAEANVAVALANFGAPAAYVTVLPDNNPVADAAVAQLRAFGVDTSRIVRGKGRMGLYYLEAGANQRPSRVVYDREGSAIALAKPGDIDWDRALAGAAWFHLTGITPAISASAADLTFEAARKARAMGITVSCDLNYRKNLWKWGRPAPEAMRELLGCADVAIVNEEHLRMAMGIAAAADTPPFAVDSDHFRALSARALAEWPNLRGIAMTLRESRSASHNGWSACWSDGKDFVASRHYEITHIVDRVGGGDAFAAGLIYGLTTLPSAREALDFAVAASCLKHSVPGDFNRFSAEEVLALVKGEGSGRVQR
ncbi:MAG TPA: sugar kinase [Bryobacteraceae bacterium]|nr:sugar kinase [Bryobacteraceae bacterium]